jgi:hypothetical protein
MLNTKLALKGSGRLALVVAAFAAMQLGCGPATPASDVPVNPPADGTADQGGADDVVVADFEEPLSDYGTWIDDPTYGHIWQPADDVAGEDFVPYTSDGSWSANDDGSWVYDSKYDTEYGWATYHYGRWVEHDDYGWVWIPGTEWGASWVDWRYGGGNVGWVPLGPPGVVVDESRWSFVDQVHFSDPGWRTYRASPDAVHAAFSASVSLSIGGGGGGSAGGGGGGHVGGPPVASIKAAGGTVRSAHVTKPAKGATKARAQASVAKAKSSNRPKPVAGAKPVKRSSPAQRAAKAQPGAKPEAKTGAKTEAKTEPKTEPKAGTKPEAKTETKPAAKPAAAKPKPEPEEAKAKPKPKADPKKKK